MIAPPNPLHKQKTGKINIHKLYPDLGNITHAQWEGRIILMFEEAERYERDGLKTSAERSLEIASLLETELNRRKTELGVQP